MYLWIRSGLTEYYPLYLRVNGSRCQVCVSYRAERIVLVPERCAIHQISNFLACKNRDWSKLSEALACAMKRQTMYVTLSTWQAADGWWRAAQMSGGQLLCSTSETVFSCRLWETCTCHWPPCICTCMNYLRHHNWTQFERFEDLNVDYLGAACLYQLEATCACD